MGKLIGFIVVLALLWVGWWAIASTGLQRGISKWFEARRAEGWQADVARIDKKGFPLRLQAQLNDVALADPRSGLGVSMTQLDIATPVYWPGYVTVALPETPVTLASPALRTTLTANDAVADLRLRPGASLQLESLALNGGTWAVDTPIGSVAGADDIAFSMVQQTRGAPVYDLKVDAKSLTPGAIPRGFLGLPADWPLAFETFTGTMSVAFDKVWDRSALNRSRPQPRAITLDLLQFVWGDVKIQASGDLTIDAAGLATGTVSVKAENWPALLDMAQNAGYVRQDFRPQAEQMLGALAQMSGKTNGLDLAITLDDGRMSMGFIPLGRAPRILIR